MRRGKEIAQGAHASCGWLADKVRSVNGSKMIYVAASLTALGGMVLGISAVYLQRTGFFGAIAFFLLTVLLAWALIRKAVYLTPEQQDWLTGKFTKICLQADDEQFSEVFQKAKEAGLNVVMIQDSGTTEFHGEKTLTCIAIGPHESGKIDAITGHLKIY